MANAAEALSQEMSALKLALWADGLSHLGDDELVNALERCRLELRGKNGFPPVFTIADVLERAGVVSEEQIEESEALAEWDRATQYAERFVVRNPEGVYEKRDFIGSRGRVRRPELSQQIRGTVKWLGGWRKLKNIREEDYPHTQRRFMQFFKAWEATNAAISRSALDADGGFQQLLEKCKMPQPKLKPAEVKSRPSNDRRGDRSVTGRQSKHSK